MIHWNGMDILDTIEELVDPKHTALVLWDFAKRIAKNTFNQDGMVANTHKLLTAARANGVRTFWSLQNNMYLVGDTGGPAVRLRMKRRHQPISDILKLPEPAHPAPRDEIVDILKPREHEIVFDKFSPNAFLGTSFEWWLKKYGIKTVVLTGINVATGISGTAREATNLGYYAVVVRDCVGTDSQADYDIAMASIECLFDVVTADDLVAVWNKSKR